MADQQFLTEEEGSSIMQRNATFCKKTHVDKAFNWK